MMDVTSHIGVLYVDLFIGDAQSLKDKRMVIKGLKDRIRNQFNVSIGELDGEDKWQTATLGVAMISNDRRYIDGILQNVLNFIERDHSVQISDHRLEFC